MGLCALGSQACRGSDVPHHGLTSFAASAESPSPILCFHIWKMGICG